MANRVVKLTSGRKLDKALIDKLASEADRGYDLSNARRLILREGRPARDEPGGESPRVASRVPQSVYRAIRRRASGEGLTVSQVIRALLAGYAAGQSTPRKTTPVKTGPEATRRHLPSVARNPEALVRSSAE